MAAEINFNPWDPSFRAFPYSFYKQLITGPPRLIDLFGPTALIARFADVTAVLKDQHRFSSVQLRAAEMAAKGPPEGPFAGASTMLFADPPVHTRLRRLVSRDFTPRRIREMEPRIREIASRLLDDVERKGTLDVIADVANALPLIVIAEMLGIPGELYPQFKHWSDAVISEGTVLPGMPMPDD